MPLKPSKRLPRAFQRSTSKLSRRFAKKHARRRRGLPFAVTMFVRQWRRVQRALSLSLKNLRLFSIGVALFLFLVAIVFFLFSSHFTVQSIRVERQDQRIDVEEIQKLLLPYFSRRLFLLSPHTIRRTILRSYPEVSTVSVWKKYPSELHVALTMDPLVALVRLGEPEETEATLVGTGSFVPEYPPHRYLTSKGVYLEESLPIGDNAEERLRIHIVDWAVKPVHRQLLVDPDLLSDIARVRKVLEESFGHTVTFVTLYIRAREFHVQIEELSLWFDRALPLVQQFEHYRAFLRTIPPGSTEQYVDLRLHDRVVYR